MVQFEVLRCLGIVLINVDNSPRNNKYASKFKFQTMKLQNLEQFYQISFFTFDSNHQKSKKGAKSENFLPKEIVPRRVILYHFLEIGVNEKNFLRLSYLY